jgi:hypothetical protein
MISKLCGLWILGKREQTKVREVSPQSQDNLLSAKFMSWIYEIWNLCSRLLSSVARFFFVHDTKTRKNVPNQHKMYQINTKCTKSTQNVPNQHKMYQINTKCTTSTQNVPNQHKMYQINTKCTKCS